MSTENSRDQLARLVAVEGHHSRGMSFHKSVLVQALAAEPLSFWCKKRVNLKLGGQTARE